MRNVPRLTQLLLLGYGLATTPLQAQDLDQEKTFVGPIPHDQALASDPFQCRFEWGYGPLVQAKIGNRLVLGPWSAGAFVELRNEKGFNHRVFPNHLWRGFLAADYSGITKPLSWGTGLLHESAHATMGIEKEKTKLADYLFDGQYRGYQRNAVHLDLHANIPAFQAEWQMVGRLYYLMESKNTPEVSGLAKDKGWAYDNGIEASIHPSASTTIRMSLLYARTFEGNGRISATRYEQVGEQFISTPGNYAILRPVTSWIWGSEINYPVGDQIGRAHV